MPKRCQNDAKTMPKRRQTATKTPPKRHQNATQTPQTPHIFAVFCGENTQSARGGNRTAYRPIPTRPQAAGPTTMLIPPWNPAFSAASYAQEIQALVEQCASIVVRPEKRDFLKSSTPDILKRNFFVVFRGKTHSARGGNRTGYRPVPTRPRAAGPTTMLIPPRSPAFSAASYAQEIQALGEQCASIVVRPGKRNFSKFRRLRLRPLYSLQSINQRLIYSLTCHLRLHAVPCMCQLAVVELKGANLAQGDCR